VKVSPADSLYTVAVDSLIPIKLNPYFEEVSYRVRERTFDYKEYSFVFTRNKHWTPLTKVVISEAVDHSIYSQLNTIYGANPALQFSQALLKVNVRHKILTSDKYPVIDSLMSSVFNKPLEIKNNDSTIYLDPAWSEIRVRTYSSEINIAMVEDSALIKWAEGVRKLLNDFN